MENFKGKKICITGRNGFIGSALSERLLKEGAILVPSIVKELDYLFLFGSPASNILFDENLDWCVSETLNSFLNAIRFCKDNRIKFIYPSSATVHTKNTSYARCKAALEEIQMAYGIPSLGLRIYTAYGPGEKHKDYYASPVYQFAKSMALGNPPVVYGDGKQSRDFIYIDDVIDAVITLSIKCKEPQVDIGTGKSTNFIEMVKTLNKFPGKPFEPIFVPKPKTYIQETPCDPTVMLKYCEPPKWTLEKGIGEIWKSLTK
jgi:UDP-glucose 4-epimerase